MNVVWHVINVEKEEAINFLTQSIAYFVFYVMQQKNVNRQNMP